MPHLPFLLLFIAALLTLAEVQCGESTLTPGAIVGDTFTAGERPAGKNVIGSQTEVGDLVWHGFGELLIREEGTVTVEDEKGAMAIVALPPSDDGAVTITADLKPKGSGFIALAFLSNGNPSDFWKQAPVWAGLKDEGGYEIRSNALKQEMKTGAATEYGFENAAFNRAELTYDAAKESVTFKINGTPVAEDIPITGAGIPTHAAVFFYKRTPAGEPQADNFAITTSTGRK